MDAHLLKAFRSGDPGTLARIYSEYAPEMRRLIMKRGRLADDETVDVIQEIFMRVLSERVRARYDGRRPFRPFLHVIARNILFDWLRRTRRDACADLDAAVDLADGAVLPEGQQMRTARMLDAVEGYVSDLPSELRVVYLERFVRPCSQQCAATSLGISRQMLRTRERRLFEGLRVVLRALLAVERESTFAAHNAERRRPYVRPIDQGECE